jgi:hypothetical protein
MIEDARGGLAGRQAGYIERDAVAQQAHGNKARAPARRHFSIRIECPAIVSVDRPGDIGKSFAHFPLISKLRHAEKSTADAAPKSMVNSRRFTECFT